MNARYLLLTLLLVPLAFGYTTTNTPEPAKIYLIDELLLRSVPDQGISIYDVSNPADLRLLTTLSLTGNHDVAVRGSSMYADQNDKLVVFDISDRLNPTPVDTIGAVFDNWQVAEVGVLDQGGSPTTVGGSSGCGGCSSASDAVVAPESMGGSNSTGTGGSLARFAIVGNYLYCIDYTSLVVFDISDPAAPRFKNRVQVSWAIETLSGYGQTLFIGGQRGMYIYDIGNPSAPRSLGEFTHANNCDPVVVENDRAYVTLRGGTPCGGFDNELDIVDVHDLLKPMLLTTVPMSGPYGLGVRDGLVVVCDGDAGIKVVDTRDLANIGTVATIDSLTAHDVILHGNLMLVTAEEGVIAYDITDLTHPVRVRTYDF